MTVPGIFCTIVGQQLFNFAVSSRIPQYINDICSETNNNNNNNKENEI